MRAILVLLLAASLGCVMRAGAVIRNVPGEYPTIVGAMTASGEGDTILVAPGVYHERIVFPSGQRMLASSFLLSGDTTAVGTTILEPDSAYAPDSLAIIEIWDPMVNAHVAGFTLRDGGGINYDTTLNDWMFGGAIFQRSGSLNVDHCVFRANHSRIGGAIMSEVNSELTIRACNFYANQCDQAVVKAQNCNLHISTSRFHHNTIVYGGAVVAFYAQWLILDSCQFDSNRNDAAFVPAALLSHADSMIVRDCDFLDNRVRFDPSAGPAGLYIGPGPSLIERCTFLRNEAGDGAALVFGTGGSADGVIRDCRFEENYSATYAGVVSCVRYNALFQFERCRFVGNRAPWWSVLTGVGSISLDHCEFFDNIAVGFDSGAAILAPFDSLIARNCIFSGNTPAAISDRLINPRLVDVRDNYWGDPSGPYHSVLNPQGLGDTIFSGTAVEFIPWLTEPPQEAAEPRVPAVPSELALYIYPNPFNPSTTISFSLPRREHVSLQVYDVLGRMVRAENWGVMEAGQYQRTFNAAQLPSGMYVMRLSAGPQMTSQKMILLR